MKTGNFKYCAETELDRGARLSAVSYDITQRAMVTEGRATVGGKAVTAEISGIATGKGEDGTVNLWLPAFRFKGSDGEVNEVPGYNAVATLAPRQGAIETAKAIASCVNHSWTPYQAKISGDRKAARIIIAFTGKKLHRPGPFARA
jgi:hypothetical protein